MRIIVTSDSHGRKENLYDIAQRHKDAELFINLGDGEEDMDHLQQLFPRIKTERVCGNGDWYSSYPTSKIITVQGLRIFMTHGHIFRVKMGYDSLIAEAKAKQVQICLFGHTHTPYCEYIDGIYFLNPGAVLHGKYGIIDITKAGVVCYPAKL